MKITTILSVVLAAVFCAIGCKKTEEPKKAPEPATPAAADADATKTPEPAPAPEVTPEPAPTPAPEPTPEPEPAPEPEPEPAPAPAPAGNGGHEAIMNDVLKSMDKLAVSLDSATDVDDAVKKIEALTPEFTKLGEAMKAAGEPDEATSSALEEKFAPQMGSFQQKAGASVMKLLGVDPADPESMLKLQADPAAMEALQTGSQKIEGAMMKLMGNLDLGN